MASSCKGREKNGPGFSRLHIHKLLEINEDDITMSGYMIYWFSMKMNNIKVYYFKPERLRILMIHNDTLMVRSICDWLETGGLLSHFDLDGLRISHGRAFFPLNLGRSTPLLKSVFV